ncbi:MAG: ATP-binding protein, partial [Oscillospiraceae bacterium]|nr:ATP-binding protein [Oscillospiraceae bacterium]
RSTSFVIIFGGIVRCCPKKDRLNHGFGLSNIENVVNKYDGKMQISCNDGMFTLSITLNNTEADLFSQHSL